jgi:hypothetical protein
MVHDARGLLVLSAAVPHHDQGTGHVGTFWSPQHARDVTEEKELFKDAVGRRLRGEAHSAFLAFRDAFCGNTAMESQGGTSTEEHLLIPESELTAALARLS